MSVDNLFVQWMMPQACVIGFLPAGFEMLIECTAGTLNEWREEFQMHALNRRQPRVETLMRSCLFLTSVVCGTVTVAMAGELPPGYVQGDGVVSYSYVPNKHWSREEALGVLPYLFEYGLFAWDDDKPLEALHEENVRRIDLASQWSTAIMFYARRPRFRDEIIRLMIRLFIGGNSSS